MVQQPPVLFLILLSPQSRTRILSVYPKEKEGHTNSPITRSQGRGQGRVNRPGAVSTMMRLGDLGQWPGSACGMSPETQVRQAVCMGSLPAFPFPL